MNTVGTVIVNGMIFHTQEDLINYIQYCVDHPFSGECNQGFLIVEYIGPSGPIIGYKLIINLNNLGQVDKIDVLIAAIGLLGDLGLGATAFGDLLGPEFWLLSEFAEFGGIVNGRIVLINQHLRDYCHNLSIDTFSTQPVL